MKKRKKKIPLLDKSSEFVDAAGVFTNDFLRSRSTDDDLSLEGRLADADTRVTAFSEFTVEELHNYVDPNKNTSSSSA